ncbi:hypothetical protein LTR37_005248 [Vermiconidia calcicola]|uniref:Uncharacterized protein n=1 Tax=Vermiconidia calcicola TaxID=1690605 RepID=A0ACC3NJY6_9PEZI|nr:hypothetical protein LTR37_005248 [Vermiconidia calcicola]
MAGDNPTVADANASTGVEPLNTGPTEPQAPKQEAATEDTIPPLLASLPTGYEPVVFPLEAAESRTKNNQTVSSMPSASLFEDLVKAKIRPAGPARAEEVDLGSVGKEHTEIAEKVREAVGGGVKVYKLEVGKGKSEWYIAGLDLDGERIIAVRTTTS